MPPNDRTEADASFAMAREQQDKLDVLDARIKAAEEILDQHRLLATQQGELLAKQGELIALHGTRLDGLDVTAAKTTAETERYVRAFQDFERLAESFMANIHTNLDKTDRYVERLEKMGDRLSEQLKIQPDYESIVKAAINDLNVAHQQIINSAKVHLGKSGTAHETRLSGVELENQAQTVMIAEVIVKQEKQEARQERQEAAQAEFMGRMNANMEVMRKSQSMPRWKFLIILASIAMGSGVLVVLAILQKQFEIPMPIVVAAPLIVTGIGYAAMREKFEPAEQAKIFEKAMGAARILMPAPVDTSKSDAERAAAKSDSARAAVKQSLPPPSK
jgi:hypothetical protein